MIKTEIFFKDTALQLDKILTRLAEYEARLLAFSHEVRDIRIEQKKDGSKSVAKFEEAFNNFAAELSEFSDKSLDYWTEVRAGLRSVNSYQMGGINALPIKNFNLKARDISREIDKLDSAAVFFRKEIRGLNLKLNIWLLDRTTADLANLVTKILFNARELSKILETKTGSTY